MKVVLVSESFAKNMGYMGNMLPRYMARLGADVHFLTTDLNPYYQLDDFEETYSDFRTDLHVGMVENYDGYLLHVLPHKRLCGYMRMVGMQEKLASIQPDIVYTFPAIGWIPLDAAIAKLSIGFKLFTGSHTTASVFPLAQREISLFDREYIGCIFKRMILGRLVSLLTEKCYGATKDCAEVATRFFGVQESKIDICPLGVDTDLFFPSSTDEENLVRLQTREKLGFAANDIVCIYTGRFTDAKNPIVLAEAIARLIAEGSSYRGLFVGHGTQGEQIKRLPGCVVLPFVPVEELPRYYRAADIGVWPTQESTSMLDATACGLPLIVNDTLIATERIDGNGLTYRLNDLLDLIRVLRLLGNPERRKELGDAGARKMVREFSWRSLSIRRLNDFQLALTGQPYSVAA